MKLNRILLLALMLSLIFISACSSNFMSGNEEAGMLNNSSWNYNYFYKNALYNFNVDFKEGDVLMIDITDDSVSPNSGEARETTISGKYSTDGNVLSLVLESVTDPLNLVYTDFKEENKIDLLYSIDSEETLTLIRADALFPVLPNEIVLSKVNVDQSNQ